MALRLYFPSSGAAAVNPAFGGWDESASADRLACDRVKISSAMTDKTVAKGTGATRALVRQYVGPQLEAQTIAAGTVKGQIRALESAANDNLDLVPLLIRVCSADGSTYRSPAIIALGDYASVLEFSASALTNRKIADGDTTAEVTIQDGDRLVIEIGIKNSGSGSSISGTLNFGDDSATDLAEDTTTTAANNPWIELSQTIAFKVARTAPSNVVGTPTSQTSIDWSWTRGATDNTDVEYRLNGGSWTALGSGTQITLTTGGLTAETSYTLEVRNKWSSDTPYSSAASSAAVFTYEVGGWSSNLNAQQAPLKSLNRLPQTDLSGSSIVFGSSAFFEIAGQKFEGPVNGKLVRIRFHLGKGGIGADPTDSVVCKLHADDSGAPGTLLATSLPITAANITSANPYVSFDFIVPYNLVSGTVYYATVSRTGALDANNHYGLEASATSVYSGGHAIQRQSGAWVNLSSKDLWFNIEQEGADWYKFEIDRVDNKLRAYRSTDSVNFSEQDAANAPTVHEGSGLFAAAVQRKGEKFYVLIPIASNQLKRTSPFDSETNTWGSATSFTLVSHSFGVNVAGVCPVFHNYREFSSQSSSFLDFTVFQANTQTVSSNPYRRIGYQNGSSNNYLTGGGTTVHYDLRSFAVDWADGTYFFYTKSDSTEIQLATLPANDLAATVVGGLSVSAVDQTTKYPLGQGCHFWRDGVNYVGVMYKDGSNVKFLYCEAGTPANTAGNWLSSTIAAVAPESTTSNPGFVVADNEQGGKLFAFFVNDTTGDLEYCHDSGSFNWTEPIVFESGFDIGGCAGTLSDRTIGMLLRDAATGNLNFRKLDVFF